MIDTPGFDDTERSDTEILMEISRLLALQYEIGMNLKGIIFLHRITDVRMQGTSMKTLQICRKICGIDALKNVILVTTRWNEVDRGLGARREEELRSEFWKFMLDFGSTMMRYHGDQGSAVAIVSQLLHKETVVLDLQREIVDQGKTLSDTAAGALVNDDIEKVKAKYENELRDLAQLRSDLMLDAANMRVQMQQEIEMEKEKLELLQSQQMKQQAALQEPIGEQVRKDIDREKKKRGNFSALGFLPMCLSLLGMVVGIPPGATDSLMSWFGDTSIGESLTGLFSF